MQGADVDHQRIQQSLAQRLHQQRGAAARNVNVRFGVLGCHQHHQRCCQHGAWPRAQADAQLANFTQLKLLAGLAQFLGFVNQHARALDNFQTKRGQLVLPANAVEQRLSQFVFQRLDAAAQCGLCQMQFERRQTE